MPRLSYDYRDNPVRQEQRLVRRLRLAAIFIVCAVLTGLGVFFLKHSADAPTPPPPEIEAAAHSEPAADPGAPPAPETPSSVVSAENAVTEAAPSEPVEPAPAPETPDAAEPATDVPVKGQPWSGDPADDVPFKAVSQVEQGAASERLEAMRAALSQGDYARCGRLARELLSAENPGSENYRRAGKLLTESVLRAAAEQRPPAGRQLRHQVASGDSLSRLARRYHTTVPGLSQLNRLKSSVIKLGGKLEVWPGPWKIVIRKETRLLELYQCDENGKADLFAVFEVGVGRQDRTPEGKFVISSRLKDPEWRSPDGRIFAPGEPGNELGAYFLKLAATGTPDKPIVGYGIHGTADESSVGRSWSSGCIRMRNAEVELLYLLVPEKTPVEIVK